jgi:hypothetical protein
MVENFSIMRSKALRTYPDYSYLLTKSSASRALESFKSTSLAFNKSNYISLFLISASLAAISAFKVAISDSALAMVVVATSILLLYSLISFSHSAS